MINSKVRSEIDNIASHIEVYACKVRSALANKTDLMDDANQLVVNAIKLTFQIGELYAIENNNQVAQPVQPVAKTPRVNIRYHNVRDSRGRFARDHNVRDSLGRFVPGHLV